MSASQDAARILKILVRLDELGQVVQSMDDEHALTLERVEGLESEMQALRGGELAVASSPGTETRAEHQSADDLATALERLQAAELRRRQRCKDAAG